MVFMSKEKKELKRLEEAARRTPSPNTFSALIKKLIQTGDEERALQEAEQAKLQFPDSDEIFDLYSRLKKAQVHVQIENLKKITEERPTPAAYAQLAEIYKDLREEENSLKYCRQAIEKFPNDDSPYLIMGELRLQRFYKDLLIKDGQIAIENLEKAAELNNKNYKALVTLSKIYLQIGAISKSREKLRAILKFAPEDDNIKKMLEVSNKVSKPSHEDVDILLQVVEDQRKLYYNLGEKKEEQKIDLTSLLPIFQNALESLKETECLACVLICDIEGNLIAHHAREGIDLNTYYEIASSIYQTVQDSSRQMDIGRFQRCQIEGDFGSIHIAGSEGVVYIAFGSVQEKAKLIYKHLKKLMSKVSLQRK